MIYFLVVLGILISVMSVVSFRLVLRQFVFPWMFVADLRSRAFPESVVSSVSQILSAPSWDLSGCEKFVRTVLPFAYARWVRVIVSPKLGQFSLV